MKLNFEITKKDLGQQIKNRLDNLKKEGVTKFNNVFTGIDELVINDDEIRISASPALFPYDKNLLSEYFTGEFFNKDLLSVIIHAYSTSDEKPEYIIVQMRSNNTENWPNTIQSAAAGFIDYGEHPRKTAIREFIEEVNITDFHIEDDPMGIVNHYLNNIVIPCFGYVIIVDTDLAQKRIRVAEDLSEFDSLEEINDHEVAKLALIPYEKFDTFWNEVLSLDRQLGIKDESMDLSIKQFIKYLRK